MIAAKICDLFPPPICDFFLLARSKYRVEDKVEGSELKAGILIGRFMKVQEREKGTELEMEVEWRWRLTWLPSLGP